MAYDPDREPSSDDREESSSSSDTKDPKDSESQKSPATAAAKQSDATESSGATEGEFGNAAEAKVTRVNSPAAKSQQKQSSREKSRRHFDEDDEDDDDDDDEDDDVEEKEATHRARPRHRSMPPRVPRRKLDIPTTEQELNVPKFQTIGMLGSVSLLMLIMWFAARLACNAHPDQIRDPRYVSVDQLARDPKNAALEFQLRFAAKDLLLAGELVSGKMADMIRERLRSCEGNMEPCEKERRDLKDKITGSASLLELSPARAVVEVTTFISNENPQTVTLDLIPAGQVWKVTQTREGSIRPPDAGPVAP